MPPCVDCKCCHCFLSCNDELQQFGQWLLPHAAGQSGLWTNFQKVWIKHLTKKRQRTRNVFDVITALEISKEALHCTFSVFGMTQPNIFNKLSLIAFWNLCYDFASSNIKFALKMVLCTLELSFQHEPFSSFTVKNSEAAFGLLLTFFVTRWHHFVWRSWLFGDWR